MTGRSRFASAVACGDLRRATVRPASCTRLAGRSLALAVRVAALCAVVVGCGDTGSIADRPGVDTAAPAPGSVPVPLAGDSPFVYPEELWDAQAEGETVVMVHVTEAGAVDSVYVVETSGEAAFDSAAVAGAYQMTFAPARRGDRQVAMWARLPVRFNRPEAGNGGTDE